MSASGDAQDAAVIHISENHGFGELSPDIIYDLLDPKSPEKYAEIGGKDAFLKALNVDPAVGLVSKTHTASHVSDNDPESAEQRRIRKRASRASSILSLNIGASEEDRSYIPPHDEANRVRVFGNNSLPEPVSKTLLQFMWGAIQDKTLIVLCIAAAVEIAIGIYKIVDKNESLAIIDGGAIIVAVLIVVMVSSINDFRKQAQFRKLNDFSKSLRGVKVLRDGRTIDIPTQHLLVGDIVMLETGDVLPADGVLIQGFNVATDESSLTGEPISINKDIVKEPFLLSGTKVVNGMGRMLAIATGVNSLNGRSMLALDVEPDETPLQSKLGKLADDIAKFGVAAASLMVIALLIAYFAVGGHKSTPDRQVFGDDVANSIVAIFVTAITLVVVAVPEGLPLAVTLSLAHATLRMLADMNLVRHLSACETMGNATTICSDKTGTLTLNRMTVVRGVIADTEFEHKDLPDNFKAMYRFAEDQHKQALLALIGLSINVNSTASETINREGNIEFNGSKTEIALLNWSLGLGFPYGPDRERVEMVDIRPFSSDKKRMSAIVKGDYDPNFEDRLGTPAVYKNVPTPDGKRCWLFVKGASEMVLKLSKWYVAADGSIKPIDDVVRARYEDAISRFANQALRTISGAFKPVAGALPEGAEAGSDEHDLIMCALFGIQDPVRPEVPGAVQSAQEAGITVRMVTGDNLATAKAIATECRILTSQGIVMEGPAFRKLSEEEMDNILPRLQVLARSSPLDKQILVRALKRLGETVAVTGDGTNDAPALKGSDVGFSMGITGTEVAKEASDIVILDDNFASIIKAVLWGRSVFDSVRKFLQFQLTVNVSAVVITIVTAIYSTVHVKEPASALTAVQLLWVNLIMDTLAALALATDPPNPSLLKRKPSRRDESIVSPPMAKMILGQAIYQIIACLIVYWLADNWYHIPAEDRDKETGVNPLISGLVFNTFVICQIFNEVNARSITRDMNILRGIWQNRIFQAILVITIVLQVIIVEFGGKVFKVPSGGLTAAQWGICIAFGAGTIPVGVLMRLLPDYNFFYKVHGQEAVELGHVLVAEQRQQPSAEPGLQEKPSRPSLLSAVQKAMHHHNIGQDARSTSGLLAPKDQWGAAIRRTQMQLRVLKAFQLPPGASAPSPHRHSIGLRPEMRRTATNRSGEELWQRARVVVAGVGVVNAFRGGRRRNEGVVGLQMTDPGQYREQRQSRDHR
ncbi:hypothetical protein HDU85_005590 [Gaertneriomyces sp. JEL0708]|nr:hypothetical protein HDU85_005590 [Gaertneriomyces sp. JEL0708]